MTAGATVKNRTDANLPAGSTGLHRIIYGGSHERSGGGCGCRRITRRWRRDLATGGLPHPAICLPKSKTDRRHRRCNILEHFNVVVFSWRPDDDPISISDPKIFPAVPRVHRVLKPLAPLKCVHARTDPTTRSAPQRQLARLLRRHPCRDHRARRRLEERDHAMEMVLRLLSWSRRSAWHPGGMALSTRNSLSRVRFSWPA